MKNIALICALPQEKTPILKRFPGSKKILFPGISAWRFLAGNNSVILIESGMGTARATEAASALLAHARPDMVLSIGFCGAIRPGMSVGDLVLARNQYMLESGAISPGSPPDESLTIGLQQKLSPYGCNAGSFITTATATIKSSIFNFIPYNITLPVLEMESTAIISTCNSAGIPVAALRTVSDTWNEDPAPLINKLFGPDLTMSRSRAAAGLLANPSLLPLAVSLARNAKMAGKSLANALAGILEAL